MRPSSDIPLTDDRAFCAIFERAVDGILLADDDGRYLRVNPAAEALTGYTEAELREMTVFDLTPTPSVEEGRSMWRAFTHGGELSGDYPLTRKDGSVVEVEFRAVASIMPGMHLSCGARPRAGRTNVACTAQPACRE